MALMLVVIVFCGKKSEIDKILPTGGKKLHKLRKLFSKIQIATTKILKYTTEYWNLTRNFYITLKTQELKRHSKNLYRK